MSIIMRGLIYVVIAAQLCACAATTPVPVVSEAQRGRMGTVGVVASLSKPQYDSVGKRSSGTAVVAVVVDWALVGAYAGLAFSLMTCVTGNCSTQLPIVGAGLGALVGLALSAEDKKAEDKKAEDKKVETEVRLRKIFEVEAELQGKLRYAVVDAANRAGIQDVIETNAGTPTVAGQGVDHRQIPNAKVDTILEVGLVSVSFIGRGGADPELALHASGDARLVDARTNAEFYKHSFMYESKPKKASEWNADEARLIKEEIGNAYRSLGQSIVHDIFLVVRTN